MQRKQLTCDTARLWKSAVRLQGSHPGNAVQGPQWEEHFQRTGVADLYREKSPPPVHDWSILMQIRTPNLHSLIGPKRNVLIGQNRATLIGP